MASSSQYLEKLTALLDREAFTDPVEDIALEESLGYVLAEPITANVPSPRFADSQMDGYVISEATARELAASGEARECVIGPEIAAGTDPASVLPDGVIPEGDGPATALPIMTGAPVPANAGAVIPVERCEPARFGTAGERVRLACTQPGSFIRAAGSDIAAGDELFPAGTEITPAVLGALAYQGLISVLVYRRPRALLCVGGAEVGSEGPAAINDVNGPMLRALCERYRIDVPATVATNDDAQALAGDLQAAIARHRPDLIITAGGISQGKHEVIRTLLREHGADDSERDSAWFDRVRQQPGGPQGHGYFHGVPVVCLPGNPISVLVSFRLFVAPALAPEICAHPSRGEMTAQLAGDAQGLPDERDQYRRGIHRYGDDGSVHAEIIGGPSSHLLAQGAQATCLIKIPATQQISAGQTVTIYPL